MQRHIAFFCVLAACKIHRLPEVPPERDPAAEQAPVVPYEAPPDVLNSELSTGDSGKSGHEGHDMGGHEGHDMGGHEGHGKKATTKEAPTHEHEHDHGGVP